MAKEFQLLFFFWPAVVFWLASQKMVILLNFYVFPPANLFFLYLYQFSRWGLCWIRWVQKPFILSMH